MTLPGRLSATVVLRHTHSWGLWVTLFFRCIDTSVTHTPLQQLPNTSHRHRRRRRRLLGSSSPRVPERRRTGSTQASLQASAVAAVPAFPPPRVIPWSLCTRAPRHPFDPIFRAIGVIVLSINPSLHLDSSSPCTAAPAAHCIAAAAVDRAPIRLFTSHTHPHPPSRVPCANPTLPRARSCSHSARPSTPSHTASLPCPSLASTSPYLGDGHRACNQKHILHVPHRRDRVGQQLGQQHDGSWPRHTRRRARCVVVVVVHGDGVDSSPSGHFGGWARARARARRRARGQRVYPLTAALDARGLWNGIRVHFLPSHRLPKAKATPLVH